MSSRLHMIKKVRKLLDTPEARRVLDMAAKIDLLYGEYDQAAEHTSAELRQTDDVASYALRNVLRDIQAEAITVSRRQLDPLVFSLQ